QEFGRLQKITTQLLMLAHQDGAQITDSHGGEQSNLARICREAAGAMLPLFEEHQRELVLHLDQSPVVRGNADMLREAIRNTLDNALYHGAGTVTIQLSSINETSLALDIMDEGNGIPLETQENMFQRFRNGHESSTGSGLGLAIVRSTLRNVGGDACFISERPCVLRLQFKRLG